LVAGVRLRLDGLSSANFARTHHEFQMTLTVGISPTNNASGNTLSTKFDFNPIIT